MSMAKNEIFLLTLGSIISSIGLVSSLTLVLELKASSDMVSDSTHLTNQSLLIDFDDTLNLSDNTEDSVYGQVRSSDNKIYVVWQESVPDSIDRNYEIFFKKSSDRGNSFGEKIRLSDNIGFSEHPQMSA